MSDRVTPGSVDDPVAAVLDAHDRGIPVALATSGTAGSPRSVIRTTDSWWLSFPAYSELTGVSSSSTVWIPGPLTATMNLYAAVHATIVGATLTADALAATHTCLTPAQLHRYNAELPPDVKVCVAGAKLHPRDAAPNLVHYYGSAELSFVASGRHGDDLRPFKGVEVDIRDGEIWARSSYLCSGYENGQTGPLRTATDGWATVGDRGVWDGNALVLLGRRGTINTAGATVSTAEVEAELARAARGPIAVYGQPHPSVGELVAVAVVREEDVPTLREHARTHLQPTHRPRYWRVVDELPMTSAGKVDTARLVETATCLK